MIRKKAFRTGEECKVFWSVMRRLHNSTANMPKEPLSGGCGSETGPRHCAQEELQNVQMSLEMVSRFRP